MTIYVKAKGMKRYASVRSRVGKDYPSIKQVIKGEAKGFCPNCFSEIKNYKKCSVCGFEPQDNSKIKKIKQY